jgi:hypothetical protein
MSVGPPQLARHEVDKSTNIIREKDDQYPNYARVALFVPHTAQEHPDPKKKKDRDKVEKVAEFERHG